MNWSLRHALPSGVVVGGILLGLTLVQRNPQLALAVSAAFLFAAVYVRWRFPPTSLRVMKVSRIQAVAAVVASALFAVAVGMAISISDLFLGLLFGSLLGYWSLLVALFLFPDVLIGAARALLLVIGGICATATGFYVTESLRVAPWGAAVLGGFLYLVFIYQGYSLGRPSGVDKTS